MASEKVILYSRTLAFCMSFLSIMFYIALTVHSRGHTSTTDSSALEIAYPTKVDATHITILLNCWDFEPCCHMIQ